MKLVIVSGFAMYSQLIMMHLAVVRIGTKCFQFHKGLVGDNIIILP